MEEGQFYASTGVELLDVTFIKNKLKLQIKEEPGVHYKIQFIGCLIDEGETSVLQEVDGVQAEFKLNKNVLFVRAKITSNKRPKQPLSKTQFENAWTQPVCFKKA